MSKKEYPEDTQEILEEMKGEGVDSPFEEERNQEEPSTEKEPSKEETPEEEPSKEEPSEEEPSEEAKEETEEVEEETPKEEEEEEPSKETDNVESVTPYEEQKMAVSKHQKQKKNWEKKLEEKDRQIEELKSKVNQGDSSKEIQSKVNEFSEKYGFSEDMTNDLLDIVKTENKDLKEKLNRFERQQQEVFQQQQYEKDFEQNVLPTLRKKYPELSNEQLATAKSKLKEYKFSPELAKVPLSYIASHHEDELENIFSTPKKKKTAEKSRPGQSKKEIVDYDSVTADDIAKMSDEEFDKYSEAMAKKQSDLKIIKH